MTLVLQALTLWTTIFMTLETREQRIEKIDNRSHHHISYINSSTLDIRKTNINFYSNMFDSTSRFDM